MCRDMVDHMVRREEERAKWEAEERWYKGEQLPFHVRCKDAWERHKPKDWTGRGLEIMQMPRLRVQDLQGPCVNDTTAYDTFRYERRVYRSKNVKVTRVVCEGVTVEETYEYV